MKPKPNVLVWYETDNHIEDMKPEFVTKLNKYLVQIKQQLLNA